MRRWKWDVRERPYSWRCCEGGREGGGEEGDCCHLAGNQKWESERKREIGCESGSSMVNPLL